MNACHTDDHALPLTAPRQDTDPERDWWSLGAASHSRCRKSAAGFLLTAANTCSRSLSCTTGSTKVCASGKDTERAVVPLRNNMNATYRPTTQGRVSLVCFSATHFQSRFQRPSSVFTTKRPTVTACMRPGPPVPQSIALRSYFLSTWDISYCL